VDAGNQQDKVGPCDAHVGAFPSRAMTTVKEVLWTR
jgi:hypothetical protein